MTPQRLTGAQFARRGKHARRATPIRTVSDDLLLATATIAATLIGLLLVAVVFYLQTGFQRLQSAAPEVSLFLRAFTKLVLLLYSLMLGLSIALVAFEREWVTLLFAVLAAAIILALVDVTKRARRLPEAVRRRHGQVWAAWLPVVGALALPWILEGWDPTQEAFTWTVFLSGALAFMGTLGLLLLAFDFAGPSWAPRDEDGSSS